MKTALLGTALLGLLLIVSFAAGAQITYQPYPENYASWVYDHETILSGTTGYSRVVLSGDTIIGGQSYNKIYTGGVIYGPPPTLTPLNYRGGMRQNTATQQTFYIEQDGTEYDISLDHSLEVGDTVPVTPEIFLAFQLTDVPLYDSITHMTVVAIDGPNCQLYFMDQFGDWRMGADYTSGRCGSVYWFEAGSSLQCYSEDGELIYGAEQNPVTIGCTLATEELLAPAFSIYPNPAGGSVTLTSDLFNGAVPVRVVDAQGRTVIAQTYEPGTLLSVEALEPGMYFVQADVEGRGTAVPLQVQD